MLGRDAQATRDATDAMNQGRNHRYFAAIVLTTLVGAALSMGCLYLARLADR